MTPLSAASGCFSRQMLKDGERLLILSNCQVHGEAQTVTSYDGSLQNRSRVTPAPPRRQSCVCLNFSR